MEVYVLVGYITHTLKVRKAKTYAEGGNPAITYTWMLGKIPQEM